MEFLLYVSVVLGFGIIIINIIGIDFCFLDCIFLGGVMIIE